MKLLKVVATLAVLGIAIHLVRVTDREVTPTTDQKYVRRIMSGHTVGEHFIFEKPVDAVEIILRATTPTSTVITLRDETNAVLSQKKIKLTTQEQWFAFSLSKKLSVGDHVVTLSGPADQDKDHATLVRYQVDSTTYPGELLIDGQPSYGDIAFRLDQRIPAWQAVARYLVITPPALAVALRTFLLAAVLALFIIPASKKWYFIGGLAVVSLLALLVRLPYLYGTHGVFGGDAFNYFMKAEALLHGQDPFAADPRKGPLWSLVILPGLFMRDPLLWSRWMGVLASVAAVVLTPLVAIRLNVPKQLALVAGIFLAVNQEFIWESPSGLANTLYALLIVLSVFLFLRAKTPRDRMYLAIALGLTALTRFEGIVLPFLFLPGVWWRYKVSWKEVLKTATICAVIIAIPLVSFVWSGASGIRTPTDIASDGGLSLIRNQTQLLLNLQALKAFFGRVWVLTTPLRFTAPAALLGMFAGLACWKKHRASWLILISWLVFIVALLAGISTDARLLVAVLPLFLACAGFVAWLGETGWEGFVILLALLSQLVIITAILPKSRYYLPFVPFLSIAIVSGTAQIIGWSSQKTKQLVLMTGLLMLAIFFYTDGKHTLGGRLEVYNQKAQSQAVLINALKFVHQQHGILAYRDGELPPIAYLWRSQRKLFLKPADEVSWLKENNISFVMDGNDDETWESLKNYPAAFEPLRTFTSPEGDAQRTVYQVHPDLLK